MPLGRAVEIAVLIAEGKVLVAEKSSDTARDHLIAEFNMDERMTQQEHEAQDGIEHPGRWRRYSGEGKCEKSKDRWGIEAENARIREAAHPGPRMDYRASQSPTSVRLTEAPESTVRLTAAPWLRRRPEERRAHPADHPLQAHEERRGGTAAHQAVKGQAHPPARTVRRSGERAEGPDHLNFQMFENQVRRRSGTQQERHPPPRGQTSIHENLHGPSQRKDQGPSSS